MTAPDPAHTPTVTWQGSAMYVRCSCGLMWASLNDTTAQSAHAQHVEQVRIMAASVSGEARDVVNSAWQAVLEGVPPTPHTPRRSVRVPDDVWHAAQAKADERGDNLSEVIRAALARYAKRKNTP